VSIKTSSIRRLLTIMSRLRDPEHGCPWDREQDFRSVAPYTIEEAYEVADAIERADLTALRDELGDLLFQVVFHSQLAMEQGAFDFEAVAAAISDKMERRHPHVFGDEKVADAAEQTVAWEEHKRRERAQRHAAGQSSARAATAGYSPEAKAEENRELPGVPASVMDDVPRALPALTRAAKLGKRAASVGFQWPDLSGVLDKIEEEVAELRAALALDSAQSERQAQIEAELGDLFFSLVNFSRHLKVDPERALRGTNQKFEQRFRHVETRLREQGKEPGQASLEEMERLWKEAKLFAS